MVDVTHQPPLLEDASSNPFDLREAVWLPTWFGNTLYRIKFMVGEKLAVDTIVGTAFMNLHVDAILCDEQKM